MKNRDRIRQYDSSLHVHFGSTGERRAVTALSLNDSLQVRLDGKRLLWSNSAQGENHECLLEEFGSEALAGNAFEAMQHALDLAVRIPKGSGRHARAGKADHHNLRGLETTRHVSRSVLPSVHWGRDLRVALGYRCASSWAVAQRPTSDSVA